MEPDAGIGRRVAAARKDLRLTQRAVADALGVSVRTIQNYETGKSVPYRHLEELSRLLRRRRAWLLYGDERPEADQLLARSRRELATARRQREELRRNTARLGELTRQLAAHKNGRPTP